MAAGHYRYNLEPASTVIKTLGGVRALASALGVAPETVSQWNRPFEHGGRDGAVPPAYWDRIYKLAARRGLARVVTKKLLRSKRLGASDMGRASKIKGDQFEYQVVRELNEVKGFKAHRVPLSGAVEGYPGDVKVETPTGDWILQCKISSVKNQRGRAVIVRLLHDMLLARVVTKRAAYVVMRRNVFFDLLRGKRPTVVNWPEMKTSGSQIAKDIAGHDALVFRRDGVKEWYALVREETWLCSSK